MATLNFPDATGQPTDGSFTHSENGYDYEWYGYWRSVTTGLNDGGEVLGTFTTPEEEITTTFDLSKTPFWSCGAIDVPNPVNGKNGQSGLIRFTDSPLSWGNAFIAPPEIIKAGDVLAFYYEGANSVYLATEPLSGSASRGAGPEYWDTASGKLFPSTAGVDVSVRNASSEETILLNNEGYSSFDKTVKVRTDGSGTLLSANSNTIQWYYGSDGSEVARVEDDGSLVLQGSIDLAGPGSGDSIELNKGTTWAWQGVQSGVRTSGIQWDGSATFAGSVISGDATSLTGAADGSQISPSGRVTASRASSSTGYVWTGFATGSPDATSTIASDGNATFAADVRANAFHTEDTGNIYTFLGHGATVGSVTGISQAIYKVTNALHYYVKDTGEVGIGNSNDSAAGTPNITLGADGNSTFAKSTVLLQSSGGSGILTIKDNGDNTKITLDGSSGIGTFAERVTGGVVAGVNTFSLAGQNGSNGEATGDVRILGGGTNQTKPVFKVYDGDGDRFSIDGSGTVKTNADFVSTTWDETSDAGVGFNLRSAKGQILLQQESTTSEVVAFQINKGNTPKITFDSDGDATFAGSVKTGESPVNGVGTGVLITNNSSGVLAGGAGGENSLWRGYTQGNSTPTSEILAKGNARFAGEVQVGGDASSGTAGIRMFEIGGMTIARTGSNPVLTAKQVGSTGTNAQINADGSASFSSKVNAIQFDSKANASAINYFGRNASDGDALTFSVTGAGNITASNVAFSLEPENPANFNAEGEYTGPTLDVKDRLTNLIDALTALKTAVAASSDVDSIKAAVASSLTDF